MQSAGWATSRPKSASSPSPGPRRCPCPSRAPTGSWSTASSLSRTDDIDAKLIVYGQLHGLAGTDHRRRDITVALLWGAPIALAFGFLAAVGSTATTMVIAAFGVWWGDGSTRCIQRITEVNLILPVLPILIMVGTMYSRSIWVILNIVILLRIFSGSIKTYRAIFLQVKESPYIDAARTYGASSIRIVFRYMIPRIAPILVPQFVVMIPSYVFLEATLAVLGSGRPHPADVGQGVGRRLLPTGHSTGGNTTGFSARPSSSWRRASASPCSASPLIASSIPG